MAKPKPSSNIVMCECGCRQTGSRFRMEEIRCEYFERSGPKMSELRSHTGRRFTVLPDHKEAFGRELNALMALRLLVKKFETAPWYIRLFAARQVYRAQFFIDRRHHSFLQTDMLATRVTVMFCSPDWLQEKLAARWRRDYKKEAADRLTAQLSPVAPATVAP
jgi:hypothetical protein